VLGASTAALLGLWSPTRSLASGPCETTTIAPGVVLERRQDGAARQALLRLAAGSTTRPLLLHRDLSSPRTPAELAATAGAVAAVNGDFFDIDRTGTPDGPVVRDGEALKADAAVQWAVGIEAGPRGWLGRVGRILLDGSATIGGRTLRLAALGTRTVPPDALALFSPAWGAGDRSFAAGSGAELEVRSGLVTAVRLPGAVPVPTDGFVLAATGAVAEELRSTALGTPAAVSVAVRDEALSPGSAGFAIGARLELVRDGAPAPIDTADPTWAALRARTAIGWTADGDLLLLTVEGGTASSRGVTATDTARRMVEAGALGAVMLDGGGSAQMVARLPGDGVVSEVVAPSDGFARPVAHVVGLVPAAVDATPTSVLLQPELAAAQVFPGTLLALRAVPLDASGAPVAAVVTLSAEPGTVAVEGAGVRGVRGVRGVQPGTSRVTGTAGAARGTLEVTVLKPVADLLLSPAPVLPTPGVPVEVTITGRDAAGTRAPVHALDVDVQADPALLRVETTGGRLRLTALVAGPLRTGVRLTCGGVTSEVQVAVGTRAVLLDPVVDPERWRVSTTRATATVSAVRVEDLSGVATALRLGYDFTGQPAGTTVAALLPSGGVAVPVSASAVVLQVRGDAVGDGVGDGTGGWLRAVLRVDGVDRPVTLAASVDFTGWRRLSAPVPVGAREITLTRVYLAQTSVARRRAGALDLARLEAAVPPSPTEGETPVVTRSARRLR